MKANSVESVVKTLKLKIKFEACMVSKHHLLNSKMEYNCCVIPRRTAKLVRTEADREVFDEPQSERAFEQKFQKEIRRR